MRTEKFVKAFQKASRPKTQGYDTQAEVRRVEGGTAWVHIPGGVDETPVKLTIDAKTGDTVQVRVSGGRAFLVGNATAPPTDNTVANEANSKASFASEAIEEQQEHFWYDGLGAHIEGISSGYRNDLKSDGMYIVKNGVVVAKFGTETEIYTTDGTELVHFGYDEGNSDGGTAIAPYYSLGVRKSGSTVGNYSVAEGWNSTASGYASLAEGNYTTASGNDSHAEGYASIASSLCSHAEGNRTTASGGYSHAEGSYSTASGYSSHAQNAFTLASSDCQTAIGMCNVEDNANTYALIIGNGASINARSNALTVDWSGNVSAAGQIKSTPTTGSVTITSGIFSSTWLNTQAVAGNMVNISIAGTFTDTSAKSWTTIGTVTNPPAVEQQGCFWGGGTDSGAFRIKTDGTISVTTASGVAQCRFNTSYIMG